MVAWVLTWVTLVGIDGISSSTCGWLVYVVGCFDMLASWLVDWLVSWSIGGLVSFLGLVCWLD